MTQAIDFAKVARAESSETVFQYRDRVLRRQDCIDALIEAILPKFREALGTPRDAIHSIVVNGNQHVTAKVSYVEPGWTFYFRDAPARSFEGRVVEFIGDGTQEVKISPVGMTAGGPVVLESDPPEFYTVIMENARNNREIEGEELKEIPLEENVMPVECVMWKSQGIWYRKVQGSDVFQFFTGVRWVDTDRVIVADKAYEQAISDYS